VLATQCLLQVKQRNLRVTVSGSLGPGVMAKDLALHLLARFGVEYGRGYVIEFAGQAVERLPMAERLSLCNMSIEMGARSSVIAPDDTTLEYVAGRPYAPAGADWDRAVELWRTLPSDQDARFDRELHVSGSDVAPMVTYGTTPAMATTVTGVVPDGDDPSYAKALAYMGLRPGDALAGQRVRTVFIGSCTNSRIEDLRAAAAVLRGRKVAGHTEVRVVPGSQAVKRQAEAEGLADVFRSAGALWGEPSSGMCLGVNGDVAPAGELVASTSNRNFEGRQGPGARTLLMSPLTAAATAVAGRVADPRAYSRSESWNQ
jgi:3-isopropylmalate/(R)-2-methylmalate dehydratase large subunit